MEASAWRDTQSRQRKPTDPDPVTGVEMGLTPSASTLGEAMKVFQKNNPLTSCPICGKSTRKEAVLIPIDGTADGNIEEAMQVHLDCLDLRVCDVAFAEGTSRVIYHKFIKENNP